MELKNKENYIGECYLATYGWGTYGSPSNDYAVNTWNKFQLKDIEDKVDDKIKIFGIWLNKKDVVFYTDIYTSQKQTIEKIYK